MLESGLYIAVVGVVSEGNDENKGKESFGNLTQLHVLDAVVK